MIGRGARAAGDRRAGPARTHRRETGLLLGILAASLNMRVAVVGLTPLLESIRRDLHMTSAVAGLLPTIPFACTGAVALLAVRLSDRVSERRLVAAGLAILAAALVLRATVATPIPLLLLTVPVGLGIGLLTVALPPAVKSWFPASGGAATGAYLAASGGGAALAGFAAVPVSHLLGGWRPAIAVHALPALAALPLWLRYTRGPAASVRPSDVVVAAQRDAVVSIPRRRRVPAVLALAFACQSACFAGTISWLSALYEGVGWSANAAGLATGVATLVSVPAAWLVPRRSDGKDRRGWLAAMAALSALGVAGMAVSPTSAAWIWVVAFGFGNGALFPLVLSLVLDAAADRREAAMLTRWTWGTGAFVSGFMPFIVGLLRDATGGFSLSFALLAGCAAAAGAAAAAIPRPVVNAPAQIGKRRR